MSFQTPVVALRVVQFMYVTHTFAKVHRMLADDVICIVLRKPIRFTVNFGRNSDPTIIDMNRTPKLITPSPSSWNKLL